MKLRAALDFVSFAAVALWLGGLVALGAVVAPTVFHAVPAPTNADAMTLVFRRFDRIALGCAAAAVMAEAIRFARPRALADEHARGAASWIALALVLLAALAAVVEAIHFSPAIEALHRAGAVRGVRGLGGSLSPGGELDALHRAAERLAKAEVALLFAVLASLALRLNAARDALVERQKRAAAREGHDRDVMVDRSGDHARFRS
jgi:hypothetical protein